MDAPKKLSARQQAAEQTQVTAAQNTGTKSSREFATVDEMLRHDALHTPVPPSVAVRLQASVEKEAPLSPSWWRRLFGGAGK